MRWRYRLERPASETFEALSGLDFSNAWLSINDGWMRVSDGYAWDGCSPAWNVRGTPVWQATMTMGQLFTGVASLIREKELAAEAAANPAPAAEA